MGPIVRGGAFAASRRAFIAMPEARSTTTGTSFRPSDVQTMRRLKPSITS